jgi:hypothetical protein
MWFKDKMLPQGEDGLGRIWFIGEKIRLWKEYGMGRRCCLKVKMGLKENNSLGRRCAPKDGH